MLHYLANKKKLFLQTSSGKQAMRPNPYLVAAVALVGSAGMTATSAFADPSCQQYSAILQNIDKNGAFESDGAVSQNKGKIGDATAGFTIGFSPGGIRSTNGSASDHANTGSSVDTSQSGVTRLACSGPRGPS